MGAFGCALYAKETAGEKSTLISAEELEKFSYKSRSAHCGKCTANCSLNIITFDNGHRFISGNKCERGAGKPRANPTDTAFPIAAFILLNASVLLSSPLALMK